MTWIGLMALLLIALLPLNPHLDTVAATEHAVI